MAKVKQLTVSLENRPGTLVHMAKAGISHSKDAQPRAGHPPGNRSKHPNQSVNRYPAYLERKR